MKLNQLKILNRYVSNPVQDKYNNEYVIALSRNNNTLTAYKCMAGENDFEEWGVISTKCFYQDPNTAPSLVIFKDKLFCLYHSNRAIFGKFRPIKSREWIVIDKSVHVYGDATFNTNNLKFQTIVKYNEEKQDEELFVFYVSTVYMRGFRYNIINVEAKKYRESKNEWHKEVLVTNKINTKYRDYLDDEFMLFDILVNEDNEFELTYTYNMDDNINKYLRKGKNVEDLLKNKHIIL